MNNRLEEISKIPDLYYKALHYVFENNLVPNDGLWLEFGVHGGGTINRIAAYTHKMIYGFDSFEGIPEQWTRLETNGVTYPKGVFSLGGKLPKVKNNVSLIKGWFKDTLPGFMSTYRDKITFIHIDSDLYSSASDILNNTVSKISNGSILVFDELIGYSGFEHHEWKAWWEFVDRYQINFEWIGGNVSRQIRFGDLEKLRFDHDRPITENISPSHENVAIRIINNPFFRD